MVKAQWEPDLSGVVKSAERDGLHKTQETSFITIGPLTFNFFGNRWTKEKHKE